MDDREYIVEGHRDDRTSTSVFYAAYLMVVYAV